jgi:7,8-dihydropterin-6-yl-methyl-4-(beta-D-ribofuranosyl)aminobenzene 5'-phosphate synthase
MSGNIRWRPGLAALFVALVWMTLSGMSPGEQAPAVAPAERAPAVAPAERAPADAPAQRSSSRVRALKVTVLSTMLADEGIGEWGFSAWIEVDGHRILFDTGARPDTVIQNAETLGIDLGGARDVVLSHHHGDHTGGLQTLRKAVARRTPAALSQVHVGRGIFYPRPSAGGGESNPMIAVRAAVQAGGGAFLEHDGPVQLFPGVWLTGPIPRRYPERNWSGSGRVRTPEGLVEDSVPEDQALVIDTDRGLVVIAGCAHAGIINTLEDARRVVRDAPIHAALGGFHLFQADERTLDWTADRLRGLNLAQLLGAHCTGLEAVYGLRRRLGLSRAACVVGAVGATFQLNEGIDPGRIAR